MKQYTTSLILLLMLLLQAGTTSAQGWKMTRNKDGIRVYQSEGTGGFKNIKVECSIPGSYESFVRALSNVSAFPSWVYANKGAHIIKKVNADDYYYYSETAIPWPLQNRDAVVHARIERDPNGRWLRLSETSVGGMMPPQSGKVRVTRSAISWMVMESKPGILNIVYLFEAEPGGAIPAWIANAFADKGPYESFRKLALLLK
jgi:hypothetical protein